MGPKIEAVTCANVPAKDLSWIDRMYLKLENMCVEVDKNPSFLLQETSKYVESQMDVVGANVKKLCAEFIQDLLPPPVLSSEGADKKPECAIHCKCDCVDSEKPKQKTTNKTIEGGNRNAGIEEVQAKGVNTTVSEFEEVKTHLSEFEEGSSSFGNSDKKNIIEVKNITEVGAIKFEERKKEVATQQQETSEAADFEGHTRKSEVNGEEHSNTIEQGAMEGEEKKIKVQQQETGQFAEFEEQLSRSKESARQSEASGDEHSHNCRQVEAHNRNTAEDVLINIEEKTTEVAVQQCVHGREAEFEGHTRRPQEGESEELGISIGQIQAHKENKAEKGVTEVEERSIEDKMQQQESKASLEGHTSRLKDSAKICMETYDFDCERQQSMKDTDLHKEMDDDAKSMYSSVSSAEDTEVGAEERDEVGGDLKSMYSYDLGELSGSSKEENPMTTSAYLIEEEYEDEEQSARWFVGEDHRNIFQMENFSFPSLFDKSPQTQRPVEEFDFDWELL